MLRIYLQILVTNQGMFRSGCTFGIYILECLFGQKLIVKLFLTSKKNFRRRKFLLEETSKEKPRRSVEGA